ncbi:MAG: DNA polymerase IV [Oligoflexales bacterium]
MHENKENYPNIHNSLLKRKIVHIDMDCFYAAVEARDNPSLRGLPLIVGGEPNSRGVVATCSYEARKFGVRSAMASSQAKRLCPNAIFVKPNFKKYKLISSQVRTILKRYTASIEPVSLDEAYLDVTEHKLYASKIAVQICATIKHELQLSASAGVGPNKLIAKIASDINKPNGIKVVVPEAAAAFMADLPLRKIGGIGPVMEKKLSSFGLQYCKDVQILKKAYLIECLGERFSTWLLERCNGIDERAVEATRIRKSFSCEDTFAKDIVSLDQVNFELSRIAAKVSSSLQKSGMAGKTISLKIKYYDFKQVTRSRTIEYHSNCPELIANISIDLAAKTEAGTKPIRLLGVGVSGINKEKEQKDLFS